MLALHKYADTHTHERTHAQTHSHIRGRMFIEKRALYAVCFGIKWQPIWSHIWLTGVLSISHLAGFPISPRWKFWEWCACHSDSNKFQLRSKQARGAEEWRKMSKLKKKIKTQTLPITIAIKKCEAQQTFFILLSLGWMSGFHCDLLLDFMCPYYCEKRSL